MRSTGMDVVSENWRGMVAAPALPEEDATAIRSAVAGSAPWLTTRAPFGWTDTYQPGEVVARLGHGEHVRVAGVFGRLGVGTS